MKIKLAFYGSYAILYLIVRTLIHVRFNSMIIDDEYKAQAPADLGSYARARMRAPDMIERDERIRAEEKAKEAKEAKPDNVYVKPSPVKD
jgi:hypothetical protein